MISINFVMGICLLILGEGAEVKVSIPADQTETTHAPQEIPGKFQRAIGINIGLTRGGEVTGDSTEKTKGLYASP